jgi:drug/metabolite transporter (DMT)-like permease
MTETVIGVLAILIGLAACLAGYAVFRMVLPILGFLVGMGLGAQLAATLFDQPYLDTPLSWVLAIVIGVLVATIAFVWWYVSVALTIAGLGYAIGYGAAIGLGLTVGGGVVAGVILAVVFALAAVILRVPIGVVIVVTAFWGSSALIGGVLILMDRIQPRQLRNGTVDVVIAESTLLLVIWLAVGIVGVLVQWFTTARSQETTGLGEPAVQ